ncbi:uncharacterized protein LOC126769101 [Nymphalis io]|uniref:uncharacterized protein LOC126769101 n=1 Tax=Inachis io TaxID=171585 RepID=UPI0021695214|nr:uncharacterized protein LOC126769101 [Nymphalis io]
MKINTMKYISELLESINRCLLPRLDFNFEESTVHAEFDVRNKNLRHNFQLLEQCLGDLDILKTKETSAIISSLLILYKELTCDCPWNNENTQEYSKKLNIYFELLCGLRLDNILQQNSNFDVQEIYDKSLDVLHGKLTYDNFKKYPGQIEVYCSIVKDLRKYKVGLNPQKIFPVSLLLIDDYNNTNRSKGLICCLSILRCMEYKDFDGGNYYEVVYRSLKKTFIEKDADVTKLTHACLLELCRMFPSDVKHVKLEEIYTGILDQLYTESNLQRKAECFKFTKHIIQLHKINCVSKNIFKTIMCDSLDVCTNEAVAEILLPSMLQCLEEWIRYCWCIWKLHSDHKMISILFKVLYTCKDEDIATHMQKLLITIISLCKTDEQEQIIADLEKAIDMENNNFNTRVETIKQEIYIGECTCK